MKSIKNYKKLPFNITKHGFISSIYFNNIFDNIIKLISDNSKRKIKILDFGSGTGSFLKKLSVKYDSYGLEPNDYARRIAIKKGLMVH